MPLEVPSFTHFRPRKLKGLEDKIVSDERSMDISFDSDRVDKALQKLKKVLKLSRKDLKVLCYHLEKVIAEDLLEVVLVQLYELFNSNKQQYPGHIKGLLASYYDLFKNEQVFNCLKCAITNSKQIRDYLEPIAMILNNSDDSRAFLFNLYGIFNVSTCLSDIEESCEVYLVGQNKNIYIAIIQLMVTSRIKQISSMEDAEFIKILMDQIYDVNILKPIFEEYLLCFIDVEFFDEQEDYVDNIFQYIDGRMGDPYKEGKARWMGISQDAMDVYTLWLTQKNIHHFFGDIAGDYQRLLFWKRYSHCFLRVDYLKRYSGAILMETKEHLFVEFDRVGGAFYMYRREVLNIEQVFNFQNLYSNTEGTRRLKDRICCSERLIHSGQWEFTFENCLARYGYQTRG